jgi:hypothetical protein
MKLLAGFTTPLLMITGTLCLGGAIRGALHHTGSWPLLAATSAAAWAGWALLIWLRYLGGRRSGHDKAEGRSAPEAGQ